MNYIHKIIIFLHRVKSTLHKQYKLNLCCFFTNPSKCKCHPIHFLPFFLPPITNQTSLYQSIFYYARLSTINRFINS